MRVSHVSEPPTVFNNVSLNSWFQIAPAEWHCCFVIASALKEFGALLQAHVRNFEWYFWRTYAFEFIVFFTYFILLYHKIIFVHYWYPWFLSHSLWVFLFFWHTTWHSCFILFMFSVMCWECRLPVSFGLFFHWYLMHQHKEFLIHRTNVEWYTPAGW